MTDHVRVATTVAVCSSMLAAATSVFAWSFARFTGAEGYAYCVPTVVFGTVWALAVVFASGVAWALAEQVGAWMAGPKPPTPPPTGPRPGDTPRPAPAPIQPRPPKPPRPPKRETAAETTLVDLAPVDDITQEIPVGYISGGYWRPPVSSTATANNSRNRV